jgi:hypothetical protein
MPKLSLFALIWSDLHQRYEIKTPEQEQGWFEEAEEDGFFHWLEAHSSFAFVGKSGRLSVVKEVRSGGNGYWYAYPIIFLLFLYLGPGMFKTFLTLRTGNAWVHVWAYHALAPHTIADTPLIVKIFHIFR